MFDEKEQDLDIKLDLDSGTEEDSLDSFLDDNDSFNLDSAELSGDVVGDDSDSLIKFDDFETDSFEKTLNAYENGEPLNSKGGVETDFDTLDLPLANEEENLFAEPVEDLGETEKAKEKPAVDFSYQALPQAEAASVAAPKKDPLFINLQWYSGDLSDKAYEISLENMPEFLDENNDIKVINIDVDSNYGWNVFFDNGVFMNLVDLKEYQTRHAALPCQSGKVIYGSKTTTFEKIEKIVVYEKPKYFSYEVR